MMKRKEEVEFISVIIPSLNEEKYIGNCLESIIESDYPKDYLEIFVVDGESTDATQSIIMEYCNQYNFIKLLINKKHTVPFALNMGIRESSGEYIIRIDSHSTFPTNYFSHLIKWSKKLNADNIGTTIVTDVKNKNNKSLAIKSVLGSKFGVGNSLFRIGTQEVCEVDTVPFGCFKREIFDRLGMFDTRLERDQDIEFNKRIKRNGGKIYLLPFISATYYARETYYGLAKNNVQTGYWNILTVYFTKRMDSLSLRHFTPLIFLLSLIIPLILAAIYPEFALLSLTSLVSYILIFSLVSIKLSQHKYSFFYLFWAYIILHFSYGFGSLIGLFRIDKLFK